MKYRCMKCGQWYLVRWPRIRCAAFHSDGHCHYGEVVTEPDPDPKGEMIA